MMIILELMDRRNKDLLVKLMHIWKYAEDGVMHIVSRRQRKRKWEWESCRFLCDKITSYIIWMDKISHAT